MALVAALEADLRALSAEARRRYPAVKDGAEHAILKVRFPHSDNAHVCCSSLNSLCVVLVSSPLCAVNCHSNIESASDWSCEEWINSYLCFLQHGLNWFMNWIVRALEFKQWDLIFYFFFWLATFFIECEWSFEQWRHPSDLSDGLWSQEHKT